MDVHFFRSSSGQDRNATKQRLQNVDSFEHKRNNMPIKTSGSDLHDGVFIIHHLQVLCHARMEETPPFSAKLHMNF